MLLLLLADITIRPFVSFTGGLQGTRAKARYPFGPVCRPTFFERPARTRALGAPQARPSATTNTNTYYDYTYTYTYACTNNTKMNNISSDTNTNDCSH